MTNTDILLVALADVTRDARTLNLARALATAGYRVTVHGAVPSATAEIHNAADASISFIPWTDPGGRAARRWWSLRQSTRRLRVRPRLVVGMDLFALDGARALARRYRVPLVYDMRELYFALGPLAGKGLRQRLVAWHEERILQSVDRVIVSGELDADLVHERFDLPLRPLVLLNTPPYRDVAASDLRLRCGVGQDVPLAIYQGVVHHGRGLRPMFQAMLLVPELHLAIVGDGPAEDELRRDAAGLGVSDRVHWLGSVPYDQLHSLTCGADVGVCLIEPLSLSYEYALPNKIFEYMMARIPSVVTDLPALAELLKHHPVGVPVDRQLLPTEIATALRHVLAGNGRAGFVGACAGITELSYERQSSKVVDLLRDMLA